MLRVTSSSMQYSPEEVWFPCSLDVLGWEERFHELMLNDELRMAAYEAAVRRAVQPNDVVLDLGTGTGILARWALESGAKRVYGIEVNSRILATAERNLQQAGFGSRFKPVNALSYYAQLPEQVDLIISEIIGNLGDNEDCHRILSDARARFLKSGGRMLPQKVTTFFVPVSSEKTHAQIEQGKCKAISEIYDLNRLLAGLEISDRFAVYYDVIMPETCYLGAAKAARTFDFEAGGAEESYQITLQFPVFADGLLTGFKGYFVANLAPGINLDISGSDVAKRTASDSWKHCYLPIRKPIYVRRGETIVFSIHRLVQQNQKSPFSYRYQWHTTVGSGKDCIDCAEVSDLKATVAGQ